MDTTPQQPKPLVIKADEPQHQEPDRKDVLKSYTGSAHKQFTNALIGGVLNTLWYPPGGTDGDREARQQAALQMMKAFKPADEIEGMLAAQAIAMHLASMECFRRSMIPDQCFDFVTRLRKDGANLARGMTEMLDALDRKRGVGRKQVVRVERVLVAPGGQAIVGNVTPGAPGGVGANGKTDEQPHAPPAGLAHDAAPGAILPPLRSQDPARQPMPIARDGERTMPDARRPKHGTKNRRRAGSHPTDEDQTR